MPAKVRPSTTAMSDSDEEPSWDTTPLTFNHWYTEIPEYLESLDADYVTMYESGYCMDKKVCVTPTEFHAVATRDRYVRKRDKGSFCNKSVGYLQYIRTAYLHVSNMYRLVS